MTDFTETLRHYCRNPRCRSKLPAPVSNPRDAFCTRGCHSSFYRKRCLICEQPMERKSENQLICGKRRCRNALQARQSLGRYMAPSDVIHPLKNPIKPGIKSGLADDRPWRIVAGQISPAAFHCATVPDGPNRQWKDGAFDRIEAKNRAALREYFDKLDSETVEHCGVCGRGDDLVDRKIADRWVTTCREHIPPVNVAQIDGVPSDWKPCAPYSPIEDDLSIPAFLLRSPVNAPPRSYDAAPVIPLREAA
jgi:hypothetical protein